MQTNILVSIIVPSDRNASRIPAYLTQLSSFLAAEYEYYEIVIVDNASDENEFSALKQAIKSIHSVKLIRLATRNKRDALIVAGLNNVIGDYVVVSDPNDAPIETISKTVTALQAGSHAVIGVADGLTPPLTTRIGKSFFAWFVTKIGRIPVAAPSGRVRGLTRYGVNAILSLNTLASIDVCARQVGLSSTTLRYKAVDPSDSHAYPSLRDYISSALTASIENSPHPMRVVSMTILAAAGFSILYIVYVLLVLIYKKHVTEGWVTLSLQSSLQFLLLTIVLMALCEYIGRVLNRVHGKPTYHVSAIDESFVDIDRDGRVNVLQHSESETAGEPGTSR